MDLNFLEDTVKEQKAEQPTSNKESQEVNKQVCA